jgi:membrane fusion protein (multidrug efflux system)
MRRTNWFVVGVLLSATLPFCGCGHKTESSAAPTLPTATVRVQTVESRKRVATEDVVGTVRPKLCSVIEAKISGRIERMLVVPGQAVKAGELLVQLHAAEIQARSDQARAVREQAEREFRRKETLFKDKTISQSEFDVADSQLAVAEASVKEAETLLGYFKVVAPFDGLVTAKRADVGDVAAPGKPLLEMEDPTTLRLEADVPEALMGKLSLGDKLSLRVPAIGAALEGTVGEIAPVADPNSRTFPVKLDLPRTTGLRSGQFGRLAVPVAEVNAIRVPAGAIIVRGQMEIAFVVVNGKAQMRLVKSGKHLEGETEIVSGLNPGEPIVIEGAAQLLDGQPVEAK